MHVDASRAQARPTRQRGGGLPSKAALQWQAITDLPIFGRVMDASLNQAKRRRVMCLRCREFWRTKPCTFARTPGT